VKATAFRTTLLLSLLLAAGSCTFSGVFSTADPSIGLITAERKLDTDISADVADGIGLSVLQGPGKEEYVVLVSDRAYDGTHVWLMKPDLGLVQTLSYADLVNDAAGSGTTYMGTGASYDAWVGPPPHVVIGNLLFDLSGGQLAFLGVLPGQSPLDWWFPSSAGGAYDVVRIGAGGSTIWASRYYDTWLAFAPEQASGTIAASGSYDLEAVLTDPTATLPADQAAICVLRDNATGVDHYARIPWSDFTAGFPTQILPAYELFSRRSDSDDMDYVGLAGGAIVLFVRNGQDWKQGDFIRLDSSTGAQLPGSLHFENRGDKRIAYSLSGTHYYVFDVSTRVLTRRAAWW
jgi:hypothetical protein